MMTEGGSNARGDRVAAKLSLLRLKLDQLGYNEPLGADSLALVDRLFSDHMHTVESVEQLQTRLDESERRAQEKSSQAQPLLNDNARLTRDCNDLHMRVVRTREEAVERERTNLERLRDADKTLRNAKFLLGQHAARVADLEETVFSQKQRIEELLGKNLNAVIETPQGTGKRQFAFNRQRMHLDATVPPAVLSTCERCAAEQATPEDSRIDIVKMAQRRISQLEAELATEMDSRESLESRIVALREQVLARDQEIMRVGAAAEYRDGIGLMVQGEQREGEERTRVKLEAQLEMLHAQNTTLESHVHELKQALNKAHADGEQTQTHLAKLQANHRVIDELAHRLRQTEQQLASQSETVFSLEAECKRLRQSLAEHDEQHFLATSTLLSSSAASSSSSSAAAAAAAVAEHERLNAQLDESRGRIAELEDQLLVVGRQAGLTSESVDVVHNLRERCNAQRTRIEQLEQSQRSERGDGRSATAWADAFRATFDAFHPSSNTLSVALCLRELKQLEWARRYLLEVAQHCLARGEYERLWEHACRTLDRSFMSASNDSSLSGSSGSGRGRRTSRLPVRVQSTHAQKEEEEEEEQEEEATQAGLREGEESLVRVLGQRLEDRNGELTALQETLEEAQRQSDALVEQVREQTTTIECLVDERDRLSAQLDLRAEQAEMDRREKESVFADEATLHAALSQTVEESQGLRQALEEHMRLVATYRRREDAWATERDGLVAHTEREKEARERTEQDLRVVVSALGQKEQELNEAMGAHAELEKALRAYVEQLQQAQAILQEAEAERAQLEDSLRRESATVATLRMEADSMSEQSEGSEHRVRHVHDENSRLREQVEGLRREVMERTFAIQEYERQVLQTRREVDSLRERIDGITDETERYEREVRTTRQVNSELSRDRDQLRADYMRAIANAEERKRERDSAVRERDEMKSILAATMKRIVDERTSP